MLGVYDEIIFLVGLNKTAELENFGQRLLLLTPSCQAKIVAFELP